MAYAKIQKVRGVGCCIADCGWYEIYAERDRRELTADAMSEAYGRFWDHCVESHGLKPDTSELPGLETASFDVLLTHGAMHVDMTAK